MSQLNDHLRIHVADDSPVWRKQLEHAFLNQPYEVLFAKDGREALEAVSHHRPHIVITDWMMPDLSGPELCQKIQTPTENRQPSKVVSKSRTPNIFIPSPETAYSSRTTEIWRKLRVSASAPKRSHSKEVVGELDSLDVSGSPSILLG